MWSGVSIYLLMKCMYGDECGLACAGHADDYQTDRLWWWFVW